MAETRSAAHSVRQRKRQHDSLSRSEKREGGGSCAELSMISPLVKGESGPLARRSLGPPQRMKGEQGTGGAGGQDSFLTLRMGGKVSRRKEKISRQRTRKVSP